MSVAKHPDTGTSVAVRPPTAYREFVAGTYPGRCTIAACLPMMAK